MDNFDDDEAYEDDEEYSDFYKDYEQYAAWDAHMLLEHLRSLGCFE